MKNYVYRLNGLDCEHCAAKVEEAVRNVGGVSHANVEYPSCICRFEAEEEALENVLQAIRTTEPDVVPEEIHETETAEYHFEIRGIDCANCAAKLAAKIAEIEGVSEADLDYGEPSTLSYVCNHDEGKRISQEIKELISAEEPEAEVIPKGHSHHHHHHEHHEECSCGCHDHEHHHHDHEEENATYLFEIRGIDCANCAAKLAAKIAEIEGISEVDLDYGEPSTLSYECAHSAGKKMAELVKETVAAQEPEAEIVSKGHQHHHHHHEHHEECSCGCHDHHHDHEHHEEERVVVMSDNTRKYSITSIDCADCAAKLERKIAGIEGISNVNISFIRSTMTYDASDADLERIEREVEELTAREEPEAVITKAATGKERKYVFRIAGIDCADCADRLAYKVSQIEGVVSAQANFMNETLEYTCAPAESGRIEEEMRAVVAYEEPEVVVSPMTDRTAVIPDDDDEDDDRRMLMRLIAGAVLFGIGLFLSGIPQIVVSLAAYLVLGYDVILKAFRNIGKGQFFDEHFLMTVATCAAIYLQDYKEAAGVMLFYQIGEFFQDMAVKRSRKSIGELMDIRPDHASVLRNGQYVTVDPDGVAIGETIRVVPGEKVPLDGVIVSGSSSLDTSSLTGESRLFDADPGDEVISGSVNGNGVLEIRVTKEYGESTVAKILELVENSDSNKASQEKFITKFSRYYTPIVVFAAIAVAIITAVLIGDINDGIERACTFLVISCPCALVISIPLSFFAGIGGLSSRGVLVKGANIIETLAQIDQVVMDKTGTLTSGEFAVEDVLDAKDRNAALRDAAYAENLSNHPLAEGIRKAYGAEIRNEEIRDAKEIAGRGLSVTVGGRKVLAGNYKLMQENGIECAEQKAAGTLVYVASDGVYEGCLVLRDQLKEGTAEAVKKLQDAGKKVMIVSGDNREITQRIGEEIHADQVFAECLPADKVETVRKLRESGKTAFVGDGVNDAPVLALADAGFAMGALGSDAAIEAADVVIMDDQPAKVSLAITAAQRILRVANENIWFAILIKIGTLILGAFGIANMWMAIFADTGVAMLCVMNSMRLLHVAEKK